MARHTLFPSMARFVLAACLLLLAAMTVSGAAPGNGAVDEAETLLGIDFGSEWIKIAVMRGGKADIVLNENSKRKSVATLSFAEGPEALRLFGESAMAKPQNALQYIRELLGKCHSLGSRNLFGPHHFPSTVQADPARGVCRLVRKGGEKYSAETLNAMLLTYARELAETQEKVSVRRCVISVPAYFTDAERRALLVAARIAGLEVLALVSDGAAVALKYSIETVGASSQAGPRRVVIYDMGATGTAASVVELTPPLPTSTSAGTVRILGAAWDRELGGAAFTERIRSLLVAAAKQSPAKDARAMARLRVKANEAKEVLSANKQVPVTVEELVGEYDLRTSVSRVQLDAAAQDLVPRILTPATDALAAAGISSSQVDSFQVVGGGWRMPLVRAELDTAWQVGTTLNADESNVLGAAWLAYFLADGKHQARLRVVELVDALPRAIELRAPGGALLGTLPRGTPLAIAAASDAAATLPFSLEGIEDDVVVDLAYEGAAVPFASFAVTGIPASLAALPPADAAGAAPRRTRVDVVVKVDRNGVTEVARAMLVVLEQAAAVPDAGEGGEQQAAAETQPRVVSAKELSVARVEVAREKGVSWVGMGAGEEAAAVEEMGRLAGLEAAVRKREASLNRLEDRKNKVRDLLGEDIGTLEAAALTALGAWIDDFGHHAPLDQIIAQEKTLEDAVGGAVADAKAGIRRKDAVTAGTSTVESGLTLVKTLPVQRPWLKQVGATALRAVKLVLVAVGMASVAGTLLGLTQAPAVFEAIRVLVDMSDARAFRDLAEDLEEELSRDLCRDSGELEE
ncbi:Hsp70 protein-domain-containing protein [Baffinella frigidus]|nr:Hsp70 protein-domain-containing protein [Cryptophyta sp. CCMP2293]